MSELQSDEIIEDILKEKLSVINQAPIRRRLLIEFKQIIKKYDYIAEFIDIEFCKDYVSSYNNPYIINIYDHHKNINYKFHILNSYPFRPPKLFINDKPYNSYLQFKSQLFRESIFKYKKRRCFCCETLLCGDNWSPSNRLLNVFEEIEKYKNECREVIYTVIIEKIKKKYLIDDINIIEWLY
jgi:ubiquitin-protein ligase